LKDKAEGAVVERKDQIQQAVQKAGEVADQRTGGKYHDKIEKAGDKALGLVDSMGGSEASSESSSPPPLDPDAPASPEPVVEPEVSSNGASPSTPAGGAAAGTPPEAA
jgi:MT0933-like antitoxin protein